MTISGGAVACLIGVLFTDIGATPGPTVPALTPEMIDPASLVEPSDSIGRAMSLRLLLANSSHVEAANGANATTRRGKLLIGSKSSSVTSGRNDWFNRSMARKIQTL